MDPIKARLNEINFLELCARIESVNHRPVEIKQFLAALANLFEFDLLKLNEITDKIFTPRLSLTRQELKYLYIKDYLTKKDLQLAFSKSARTIQRIKNTSIDDYMLYPRLNEEEQESLEVFMVQYDKYFTKNYLNILGVERED